MPFFVRREQSNKPNRTCNEEQETLGFFLVFCCIKYVKLLTVSSVTISSESVKLIISSFILGYEGMKAGESIWQP